MQRGSRVLVIEDDETLRETIAEVISDEGHEIRLAANGHQALEQLEQWEADVVILDLMMPLMDAFEFRERQRDGGAGASAKVLIVSAARNIESAAEQLGASAWLGKPFELTEMLDAVDSLLDDRAD